jgi:cysteine desulfuration protein SufE
MERSRRTLASRARAAQFRAVTLAEKQARMIEDLAIIDDPQERLALVVDRARKRPPLAEGERTEAHRVKGCISQAWLVGELRAGRCHFRCDADSPLVRGLVVLLCDLYSDATPADVAATEPALLEELGLARNLSPTRLNGLRSVRAAIRDFATAARNQAATP